MPMYVDWEYYKIFYYVAKYQNFTLSLIHI